MPADETRDESRAESRDGTFHSVTVSLDDRFTECDGCGPGNEGEGKQGEGKQGEGRQGAGMHGSSASLAEDGSWKLKEETLRLEPSTAAAVATLACTTPTAGAAARTQHCRCRYHARLHHPCR